MKKHNFKIEDRVFDIRYGWVTVSETMDMYDDKIILSTKQPNNGRHPLIWDYYEEDMKFLSFTEYTLDGITQERQKEEFKIGQIGYFYDDNYIEQQRPVIYGKLTGYDKNLYTERGDVNWDNFSLTPPDLNY